MKNRLIITTTCVLLFITIHLSAQSLEGDFATNRLIVKLKDSYQNALQTRQTATNFSFGIADIDRLNADLDCNKATLIRGGGEIRSIILEFKKPIDIREAASDYLNTGKFEYVEPDFIGHGAGMEACPPELTPNDGSFNKQWGLKNDGTFSLGTVVAGNDIKAVDAWSITTGNPSVVVCILDSGCKLDHPEVAGRIWQNTKEIANNGLDDDGNGKIDDTQGWDFANSDNNPSDDHGHGSNVTGIVGATGNNTIGVTGMDWQCKLMIVKGLNSSNSGFYSWWESGIYYAVDNGAKVINMSLVGASNSASLEAAVNYAWTKGVIVVACMGNENDGAPHFPAGFSNLIAVGSVNPDGKRTEPFFWSATSGSNYGSNIDVCAPGNYIYGLSFNSNTSYGTYWGGTSQATPHAAGLASLMLAKNKTLTPAQIKDYMQKGCDDQTGDPTQDIKGYDNYYGWGRINAKKTLDLIPAGTAVKDLNDVSAALQVFPNPTNSVFTLSTTQILRGGVNIEISNIEGQIVYKKSLQSVGNQLFMDIDLSTQPKGIYFLHVNNEAVFMNKKIIKQ